MAVFDGVALFGDEVFPNKPTAIPTTGLVVGDWRDSIDTIPPIPGDTFIDEASADRLTATFGGTISYSYFDDYYNRIWFIPSAVDFGPVVSDSMFNVYLWNAHLNPVTVSDIAGGAEDGSVTLTGIAEGRVVPALSGFIFGVMAAGEGEPSIGFSYGFTFSPSEYVLLPVAGVRSRLWPFSPNWSDGYSMTLEYRSEVITSYEGDEQRRSLRQAPRKSISFSSLVTGDTWRQFLRHMSSWQQRSTMVPEFGRPSRLTAAVAAGATFLPMVRSQWINAGDIVTLHQGRPTGNKSTVRTVESVSDSGVTLTAPIDMAWAAGSRVYPTLTGRMATRINTDMHSNNTATVSVEFAADPGIEADIDIGVPAVVHLGREVLLRRPNWGGSVSPEFEAVIDTLDYGVGRLDRQNPIPFNTRYHKAEFLGIKAADVTGIENFFRRQRGQVGEFFMPTFTEDLIAKLPVDAGTSILRFAGTDVFKDYRADLTYRDIIVLKNDGTYEIKHILSIYTVDDLIGNDTVMQFTEGWVSGFTLAQVKMICWMPLWRFASDSLTIAWVTSESAQVAVNMKTLPYEVAE